MRCFEGVINGTGYKVQINPWSSESVWGYNLFLPPQRRSRVTQLKWSAIEKKEKIWGPLRTIFENRVCSCYALRYRSSKKGLCIGVINGKGYKVQINPWNYFTLYTRKVTFSPSKTLVPSASSFVLTDEIKLQLRCNSL